MEKYTLEFLKDVDNIKKIPQSSKQKVYDQNDNVLFGSHYIKGAVSYNYVPAELMETGRPFFVGSTISYDGVGNKGLPADAVILPFNEIKAMFPDNQ